MKTKQIMTVMIGIFSLFLLDACSKEETKVYEPFTVTCEEMNASSEVYAYISLLCEELTNGRLSSNMEQSEAESIFDDFCASVPGKVKEKELRVLPNQWVKLKLKSLTSNFSSEKQVNLQQTDTYKKYLDLVLTELAPNGDTDKATTYLEALLKPYDATKETTTVNGLVQNTYRVHKEYTSSTEADQYYNSVKHELDELDNTIDKQWPADIIYTGEINISYVYINEESGLGGASHVEGLTLHKPSILKTTWKTESSDAPFAQMTFKINNNEDVAPYFVNYKMAENDAYIISRQGYRMIFMEGEKIAYGFRILDANTMQVVQVGSETVIGGAIYTRQ